MKLVSLGLAKKHLNVVHPDEDELLLAYIEAASSVVQNYLKGGLDPYLESTGEPETNGQGEPQGIPGEIEMATLIMIGYFYKNRDEDPDSAYGLGSLPRAVTALLYPLRDPSMA